MSLLFTFRLTLIACAGRGSIFPKCSFQDFYISLCGIVERSIKSLTAGSEL